MQPGTDLTMKRAAGCIVYRYDGGALLILLILDKYGRWTLPKGHLEPGESAKSSRRPPSMARSGRWWLGSPTR
jgi:8-oxo-dGTP pyrophosphatase MutT (NUDIX family)